MKEINDGGPAFPLRVENNSDEPSVAHGVEIAPGYVAQFSGATLRDYFAAKAMQGFCTRPPEDFADMRMVAEQAYELADTMLAAREQTEE